MKPARASRRSIDLPRYTANTTSCWTPSSFHHQRPSAARHGLKPNRSASVPALQTREQHTSTRRIDHPDRDLYSKQNKQASMRTYIPTDLLYEIFSRLPVKSLLRFRCVSSLCRSIIDDPYLAYMHQSRSSEEPNVLVFHHSHCKTEVVIRREGRLITKASLSRVSKPATLKNYHLQCSCNGLSCFVKHNFDGSALLILFNPLRNQLVSLLPAPAVNPSQGPSPRQNIPTTEHYERDLDYLAVYGLGFDCSENTYKIVRVLLGSDEEDNFSVIHGEVFTLGTSSWRLIPKGPSCRLVGLPVFACGNIHWFAADYENYFETLSKIVSFDISKEEFGLIYPPHELRNLSWPCHLLDINGNLAIANNAIWPHIHIWVLKDYERKDQWIKQYDIDLKPPRYPPFLRICVRVIGVVESGRILILNCGGKLVSCDVKNGRLRYVRNDIQPNVQCNKASLLSISGFHSN